jgi:hypothetical protein
MKVAFEPADALDFRREVAGMSFELLNANHVGACARKPRRESLASRGANAVHIERYNSQHL